ncbi:MAG: AAA family ATPase [Candidatus Symbiobacter sp.]|nr:AAA family ATPase [Candidatus Symbiobacter sp.]
MKIRMQNIGPLKDATIETGKLTVMTGTNNTGKTYAMYVLWAAIKNTFKNHPNYSNLKCLEKYAEQLLQNKTVTINILEIISNNSNEFDEYFSSGFQNSLDSVFNMNGFLGETHFVSLEYNYNYLSDLFYEIDFMPNMGDVFDWELKNGLITFKINTFDEYYDSEDVDFDEEGKAIDPIIHKTESEAEYNQSIDNLNKESAIKEIGISTIESLIIAGRYYQKPHFYFIPASRNGLNLTFQETNEYKANLLQEIKRPVQRISKEILDKMPVAAYPEPVEEYVEMLAKARRLHGVSSENEDEYMKYIQEKLSKVRYSIDDQGNVYGTPLNKKLPIPLYLLSSTSSSLYGLWLWLQLKEELHQHNLMIDEPELNLHPENQILLARLLVRLVKGGAKIAISTHSDYIVREISNMMMLSQEFPNRDEFAEMYDYDLEHETINPDDVKAYHFTTQGDHAVVTPCPILNPGGIEVPSMDATIEKQNDCYNTLYQTIVSNRDKPK